MPIRLHLGERPHEANSGERSVAGATRDARGATHDGVRQSDSERPQSLVISDPVCRGSVRCRWGARGTVSPAAREICNYKLETELTTGTPLRAGTPLRPS